MPPPTVRLAAALWFHPVKFKSPDRVKVPSCCANLPETAVPLIKAPSIEVRDTVPASASPERLAELNTISAEAGRIT